MVTQERLKELLHYIPETGIFSWKVSQGGRNAGDKAGCIQTLPNGKSYIHIRIDGKLHLSHRLVWLFIHGEFPAGQIDHTNGDGINNRLSNLRSVMGSENAKNSRLYSNNTSGHPGVHWYTASRKWQSKIQVSSKTLHLGYFADLTDAIAARKAAEIEHGFHSNHGESRPL